jgi:transcriptional regulator with GAF, ATPase, and Fis domain/CHASE2 domain-containing sensor protein
MKNVGQHQGATACLIGLAATAAMWLLAAALPLLSSWEWSTYDARLRWRGPAKAGQDLVVIGRDQAGDLRFGTGLWDRAVFARVINGLGQAGAAVIALDFHFAGASPPERGGSVSDRALFDATKAAGTVVYPVPVTIAAPGTRMAADPLDPDELELVRRGAVGSISESAEALASAQSLLVPLPTLLRAARGIGHIAAASDEDGVYRAVPAALNVGTIPVPAFGLTAAALFLQTAPARIGVKPGRSLTLPTPNRPGSEASSEPITIPLDQDSRMLVNYAGRWEDGAFPYFSFVDVWDAIEGGDALELRRHVEGKLVLILHASLGSDKRRTPFEVKAPGGFVHANVINTILTGQTLRPTPIAVQGLLTVVLAGTAAWLVLAVSGWRGAGSVLALALIYIGATQAGLSMSGLVLPLLPPLFASILAAGVALVAQRAEATALVRRLEGHVLEANRALALTKRELAHHELAVERLEEDLTAAQAEAAATVDQKQAMLLETERLARDLAAATRQVDAKRQDIRRLEQRLAALMPAGAGPPQPLTDRQLESLRQDAEQWGIVTQDQRMLSVLRDLKKAAQSRAPILLLGETGTGKELLARAAHGQSPRAQAAFVAVNVAALPPDLAESELFGHVRGAFTGADRDRKGYFEQADRGTLFLDEIGDLSLPIQAKLLRALQDHSFQKVGAASPTRVDIRVVAATNRDLAQGVVGGWFREDLFFRLQGIEFRLPPLRERTGDIALLADGFLQAMARETGRAGVGLSSDAAAALQRWPWPGNVRELKQCIERAVILSNGTLLTEQDLRLDTPPPTIKATAPSKVTEGERPPSVDVSGDSAVLAHLRAYGFDMHRAAQALGWDRSTVTQRLKGLCFRTLVEHQGDRHAAAVALAGDSALLRTVEMRLNDYAGHLLHIAGAFQSAEDAVTACRKRFKNLPDRYFTAVETLIRREFDRTRPGAVKETTVVERTP